MLYRDSGLQNIFECGYNTEASDIHGLRLIHLPSKYFLSGYFCFCSILAHVSFNATARLNTK